MTLSPSASTAASSLALATNLPSKLYVSLPVGGDRLETPQL
ncbi:MAG: hypothetical protein ACREBW_07530 [Candidatus Micrarchaeaceae archaeon]